MTETPNRFDEQRGREEDLPPEADDTDEQDQDAKEQAQTVAEEARNRSASPTPEDSEKVPTGSEFDDVPDLVDRLEQMDSSGRVDLDAYRGEPNHDDNVDKLGEARKVDPKLRGDGT